MDEPKDITVLIHAAAGGDPRAASQLLPIVYEELRVLASQRLAKERPGLTLQATALVHEAYIRLVGGKDEPKWSGRNHFYAAAAIAMRRILVERARAYAGPKRGGGKQREELAESAVLTGEGEPQVVDWIALDGALADLEKEDARLAELVMLRFFAGLSFEQAAEAMGLSSRTIKRDWNYARAWLYERMMGDAG